MSGCCQGILVSPKCMNPELGSGETGDVALLFTYAVMAPSGLLA